MSYEVVDKPTYEVVGPLKRFDERDNVFARERLIPGSPEERAYHALHPELVGVDRRLAACIKGKADAQSQDEDWIGAAFYSATFGPVAALAQPDMVDGPVSPQKVEGEPAEMAQRVKKLARYLGADLVRIGPLNPAWVYSHRGRRPFFEGYRANPPFFVGIPDGYRDLKWGARIEIPHHYAISMAFVQDDRLMRTTPSPVSNLEVGQVYARSALASVQLARYIRALGYSARAHHLRNYGVLVVPVAVDAGLGELARSGYLITKELGLNFRLACVTTDLPMALDGPVDLGVQDFCQKCLKCAENCPPRAIPRGEKVVVREVRKWKLDEVKCLLYWRHIGSACAICQVVCPWSKPRMLFHRFVAEIVTRVPAARRFLVWADDLVYGANFEPRPEPEWVK
jgi:reductive dehalogenase